MDVVEVIGRLIPLELSFVYANSVVEWRLRWLEGRDDSPDGLGGRGLVSKVSGVKQLGIQHVTDSRPTLSTYVTHIPILVSISSMAYGKHHVKFVF